MRTSVLALFLLAGCDHDHPHGPAAPAEGEKTVQVSVWGDRYEIFLEHGRLVAGAATDFVTHVTDLSTSEPRREGPVAFVLRQGDSPVLEHVESGPKRPGIYLPALRLPTPGSWELRLRIGDATVDLPPVRVYASKEEAAKAPDAEAPEGITFLKEQQWKLRTKAEPAGTRRLVGRLRLPAVVSARPGSRASVLPPVPGRLLALPGRPFPTLGERVEAGQVLALVQPPLSELAARLVEAEAEVARTAIALSRAELSHARIRKLAAGEAKTARELEESDFDLRAAKGAHEAALALRKAFEKTGISFREEAGGLPVLELRAPIAGVVVRGGAAVGEHVPTDRAVFTLLSSDAVLVEAHLAEADVARAGRSRDAVYETPDARGTFVPLLGGGGKLLFLGPEVDAATRCVPLVYEVPNPMGALRVGMSLTVHVETERAEAALAVPETALVDEEGRAVAFVQLAGETFERRDLKLGIRDSGFVQVLGGLAAGERVVTKGAYAVRLASVSTSLPAHGHSH
jgi:RND family efflux transporter MFP subunit